MGISFNLESVNQIAYLTSGTVDYRKIDKGKIEDFLRSIAYNQNLQENLISNNSHWIEEIKKIAATALVAIEIFNDKSDPLCLADTLEPLRLKLSCFRTLCFPLSWQSDFDKLKSHAIKSARQDHNTLYLIPDRSFELADTALGNAFPAFEKITSTVNEWPGLLYWNNSLDNPNAYFLPLKDPPRPNQIDLRSNVMSGSIGFAISGRVNQHKTLIHKAEIKILHLSDLHFGSAYASRNQDYLLSHLGKLKGEITHIVISGDLIDNPKKNDFQQFQTFRKNLSEKFDLDPIIVPGNHDQKKFGNIKTRLKIPAQLEWKRFVIDHENKCIFACFDSSIDSGNLAKGIITEDQLIQMADRIENETTNSPTVEEYVLIVVVHHHPISFETENFTHIQRMLSVFGFSDESVLKMEESERFLNWCAKRNVSIILHGHKHSQRHSRAMIECTENSSNITKKIDAVGCGSSLGAEGCHLSYNVITFDRKNKLWAITFSASDRGGSGFSRQAISITAK